MKPKSKCKPSSCHSVVETPHMSVSYDYHVLYCVPATKS